MAALARQLAVQAARLIQPVVRQVVGLPEAIQQVEQAVNHHRLQRGHLHPKNLRRKNKLHLCEIKFMA
jgi:hypothetical protein